MGDAARLFIVKQASHLSYLSFGPRFLPPLSRREKNIASKTVRTELHNNILDFLIHGDWNTEGGGTGDDAVVPAWRRRLN